MSIMWNRVAPDQPAAGYPAIFLPDIRNPAGYPVRPDIRYPAGYPAKYPLKENRVYCWLDFCGYFVMFFYRIFKAFITLINSAFFLYNRFPEQ